MYTEIELRKVENAIIQMDEAERKLRKEYLELVELRSRLCSLEMKSIYEIRKKLYIQIERLEREIAKVQKLRTSMKRIVHLYEQCEYKIMDYEDRTVLPIISVIDINFDSWWRILYDTQILFK